MEIYDVVCPYCCAKFHPAKSHFRLKETAAGSPDAQSARGKFFDQKLFNYYTRGLALDEDVSRMEAMQFMVVDVNQQEDSTGRIYFDEAEMRKYGFVQKITYVDAESNEHETNVRLCPSCHNTLPVGAGLRKTILISVIGGTYVGKSVYLTMLIEMLEKDPYFSPSLNFIGDRESKLKFDTGYKIPLLKNKQLIAATERKRIPPFSYNYQYKCKTGSGVADKDINIIFYDVSGEDCKFGDTMSQNGFNIKDSSGIIYIVDPTNFSKTKDFFRLADSNIVLGETPENSYQEVFDAMYNFFLGASGERSQIPLAVVLSKVDLFKEVYFEYFKNTPQSRIITSDAEHKGYIDVKSLKGLDLEVRELLEKQFDAIPLINNADNKFKHVSFFAVSSLGSKPSCEKKIDEYTKNVIRKDFIENEIVPFRVTDPFYWILMKNNMLYNMENNVFYMNEQPVQSRMAENKGNSLFTKIKSLFKTR